MLVTSPASGHNAMPDISQYVLKKAFFSQPHIHLVHFLNQKLQISPTFSYLLYVCHGPGSVTLCLCI